MALLITACWGGTRTHRNPLLSFLFSGWSLSRSAERRFSGELLNDPPRTTRLQVFRACQPYSATHRAACQGPGRIMPLAFVLPLPEGEGGGEGVWATPASIPHPNPLPEGEGT
jgi:hypothetical protein